MSITINHFSFTRNRQMNVNNGLKSTKEKIARQEKCENQVKFWENQKQNLKNWEGSTLEDIARKLEMFHSYEDQIDAVKAAYNNEQMWHMMDEAKERAEKLAEHLEETAPKTPEERKEDLVEEALGTDENKGMLSEILDGMEEVLEDLESIENIENLENLENLEEPDEPEDLEQLEQIEETAGQLQQETAQAYEPKVYKRFDMRI